MPVYRALSVRQPYAYLLVAGIKTCENRTWPTHHAMKDRERSGGLGRAYICHEDYVTSSD